MEVSYATMIAMGTLVQRLGRDAQRYQAALAEAVNESTEWKRIADELKAERNAERKAHDEYKERNRELFNQNQRLTAELVVIKDERGALRAQLDTERERHTQTASLLAQYAPTTVDVPRAHPVNREVGAWVSKNCTPCDPPTASHDTPEGKAVAESASEDIRVGDMVEVFQKTSSDTLFDDVSIHGTVSEVFWAETGNKCVRLDSSTMNRRSRGGSYFAYCDVRKIAKETAEAAAEPKPGDVVRLVRVPTPNEYPHDSGRWEPNWGGSGDYMRVHYVGSNINGTRVVRAVFGLEWPLSCVEVVKGGGK